MGGGGVMFSKCDRGVVTSRPRAIYAYLWGGGVIFSKCDKRCCDIPEPPNGCCPITTWCSDHKLTLHNWHVKWTRFLLRFQTYQWYKQGKTCQPTKERNPSSLSGWKKKGRKRHCECFRGVGPQKHKRHRSFFSVTRWLVWLCICFDAIA